MTALTVILLAIAQQFGMAGTSVAQRNLQAAAWAKSYDLGTRKPLMATTQLQPSDRLPLRLADILVCPRDRQPLLQETDELVCGNGHRYVVVEGIPILLVSEAEQTHIEGTRALLLAKTRDFSSLPRFNVVQREIDPFVRNAIAATNGGFYKHLVGNLKEYPIPHLRLPAGEGRLFLEVGCSWGRWCLAAAAAGYQPVGIDPSLPGIRAAKRVAQQLGIEVAYVVGDSRFLPFRDGVFDQSFSYSVLQHISKDNARTSLAEIHRVLRAGGNSLVQMPNVFGVRCLYHQIRRGFRETRDFEVRYWTPRELRAAFTEYVGPSELSVDGYFSLNAQVSDLHLLPARYRALVRISESLRKLSRYVPPLLAAADSLYVSSWKV